MPCSPLIEPSSATTPSNSAPLGRVARARSRRRPSGSTMMLTWMLPSPAWPNDGDRAGRSAALQFCDERRTAPGRGPWHDDVVVELERGPSPCSASESSRRTRQSSSRSASSRARRTRRRPPCHGTRARRATISSSTAAASAVHFDDAARARCRQAATRRAECGSARRRASPRRSARARPARRARDQLASPPSTASLDVRKAARRAWPAPAASEPAAA